MKPRAAAAVTPLDVNTFVGGYPFRHVPHPDPDALVRVLDREGVERAWVGHLPSVFHRDPTHGNAELRELLSPYRERLDPVPAIRPDWPGWRVELARAVGEGSPAVRVYPPQWGLETGDARMTELASTCGETGTALVLTIRFEDVRQRHRLDTAGDLSAAAVRALARAGTGTTLVVTSAARELIEETHWGLTPAERSHVFWDISWIWGPPGDDLTTLLRTIGPDRFVYGSGWPLRLAQAPRANLALLSEDLRGVKLSDPRGGQERPARP